MIKGEIIQYLLDMQKVPMYIMMVGAPGSGKSTLAQELSAVLPAIVCNTDDTLEARARGMKIQPHEMHGKINFGMVTTVLARKIWENLNYGKHVIVDQTSITAESRFKKLKLCKTKHLKVCIDMFDGTGASELSDRVARRFKTGGRYVPSRIIHEMHRAYEPPQLDSSSHPI